MSVAATTTKTLEALKKATQDSCAGGGVGSGPAFRLLWEPTEGNNNFRELADLFNRNELEQEYLTKSTADSFKYFDLMKSQAQNDFIAQVHRDMTMRFSGRIHRIMEEAARRKNIATPNTGLLAVLETNITNFLALKEGGKA